MLSTESFPVQLDYLLHRVSEKLQLTRTQHRIAEERYRSVGDWLEADKNGLALLNPEIYPQGSLLIGTTVKPLARQEYDLDLVCEFTMDFRRVNNPILLLDAVENRLRQHDQYKAMLKRKNRCVSIEYQNEFHMDILPACSDPSSGSGCIAIPDREAQIWKASNPKGFASWFEEKANGFDRALLERMAPPPGYQPLEMKPPLKRAVQLLKRWRDIHFRANSEMAPVSVVLTTLAATHYAGEVTVAGAVAAIIDRVLESLPSSGHRLIVLNPANSKDDLSERWSTKRGAYEAFVRGLRSLQADWGSIVQARGLHHISAKLEGLFGEDVAKTAVREHAEYVEKTRQRASLGVARGAGVLSALSGPSVLPIRKNTFYGS